MHMPNRMNGPVLATCLPHGFMKDYIDYAGRLTDAPAEFHAFTALAALGAAASRVRIPYGNISAPPTLWAVLVAPSAFYRKTTSIELGRRLLAAACPDAVTPMLYRADELHQQLRHGQRLLAVDQFTALLTHEARERLLEYADSHVPLSILAAASTAHVSAQVASLDIASGFLSRFVLVVAEQKTKLLGLPGTPEAETEAKLAGFLARAAQLDGTASFTRAWPVFEKWGRAAVRWISAQSGHTGLCDSAAGLASRLELTLLKLAALIEIAANHPERSAPGCSLDVSPESMRAAMALEHIARLSFTRLVNQEIGRARQFQQQLRVLGIIRRHPGITRRRLQQNSHLDADTLRRVLNQLEHAGRLRRAGDRMMAARRANNDLLQLAEA